MFHVDTTRSEAGAYDGRIRIGATGQRQARAISCCCGTRPPVANVASSSHSAEHMFLLANCRSDVSMPDAGVVRRFLQTSVAMAEKSQVH